jgi:hypothetical protein
LLIAAGFRLDGCGGSRFFPFSISLEEACDSFYQVKPPGILKSDLIPRK